MSNECTRTGYDIGECSCKSCVELDMKREEMAKVFYKEGEIKYSRVSIDGAAAYQIVKINDKRFKLHADTDKSSCVGFDRDMCAKIVMPDGTIENLFDARSVGGYPDGSYCGSTSVARTHVERCFRAMRAHLKELYL